MDKHLDGGYRSPLSTTGGLSVHRSVRVSLAFVLLLSVPLLGVSPAGAAGGTTCKSLGGNAVLSPPLPKFGSTELVQSRVAIAGAKLSGCRGAASGGKVAAKLQFKKRSNCTLLITQSTAGVPSRVSGTLTITWNTRRTSTIALSLSFGGVRSAPSLAAIAGAVTAGQFKGMKVSGTVLWSLGTEECFGGAPLKSFTFSEFDPLVLK